MKLVERAFKELYPDKELNYNFSLKYSAKFKPYNANVRFRGKTLFFHMSKKWRSVSKEIQIGLIQELLVKVIKDKRRTSNMDLYNIFIKKAELAAPKTKTDEFLEKSFDRVNERYFYGMIEKPNLVWHNSSNRLGSYEYGSDTISISSALKDIDLLDYVMYHEMLHKKYKFVNKNGRNYHHTGHFKKKEKEFENQQQVERRLKTLRAPRRQVRRNSLFRRLLSFP
ncbi:SprT-like domain-containing protein [Candidatus Woesearchaeota archaeon]|nr:SprT-like domain-containing protein [Candidatus Woesearchaeota archaeon]